MEALNEIKVNTHSVSSLINEVDVDIFRDQMARLPRFQGKIVCNS